MTLKSLVVVALPIAWLAAPVAGAADPPLSEAMTVELVNVDVHVVGRDGRPLADLPREAFRVLEDGQPVEVSHFAWIPAADPDSGAADERAPSEPRHLAVLFDELQTGDGSRGKLIAALRTRLAASLRPEDRVTVLRFDGADVKVLLDASTDRSQLEDALRDLGVFSPRRLLTANETRSALETLQYDVTQDACQHTAEFLRMYADTVLTQVKSSAGALLRAAQRLAPAAGRKVLLHVSDGIPMIAGGEGYEYAIEMCDGTAMMKGVPKAWNVFFDGLDQVTVRDRFDPGKARLEFADYSTARLWTDVASRVNTLGVTIYTLQAGAGDRGFLPEIEGGHSSATARQFARENPRQTLAFLAAETGGLMVDASANEIAGVDRLVEDLSAYYSLAFAPTAAGRAGLRAIRVEVDRPGVELRYRQSYRRQTAGERIAYQLAALFESGGDRSGRSDNPLAISLAVAAATASAPRTARLTVPLDRLGAVDHADGTRAGRLTVYLLLRKHGGAVLPLRQRTLEIPLPAAGSSAAETTYVYEVAIPDSATQIALATLDEYSGQLAFVRGNAPGPVR